MSSKSRQSASSQNKKARKQNSSSVTSSEEEEYEVEKILDFKINPKTKGKEYLVKWKNWPIDDSTWEPQDHLDNVKDIIGTFERSLKKKESATAIVAPSGPTATRSNAQKDSKRRGNSLGKHGDDEAPKEETKKSIKPSEPPKRQMTKKKSISSESSSPQQEDKNEPLQLSYEDGQQNQIEQEQDAEELVFEEVVDKRLVNGQTEYLIRFQNVAENQWLESSQLFTIKDEIQVFESKLAAAAAAEAKNKIALAANSDEDEVQQRELRSKQTTTSSKRQTAKRSVPLDGDKKTILPTAPLKNVPSENPVKQTKSTAVQQQQQPQPQPQPQPQQQVSVAETKTQKRQLLEIEDLVQGEFKTDNVEKIELQGDFSDILSSRFEVFWKTRKDGLTPSSGVYSSSYLKRYEPGVLIDYLIHMNSSRPATNSILTQIH